MSQSNFIRVNNRIYELRLLPPMDAYDFFVEYSCGPSRIDVKRKAISRCVTPDGGILDTSDGFNDWFSVYPGDLMPLGDLAAGKLAADFGEKMSVYRREHQQLWRGVKQQNVSKTPNGWSKIAFFGRLINAGHCTFDKLVDGTITLEHVFEMHRMLDLQDYYIHKAFEAQKAQMKRR